MNAGAKPLLKVAGQARRGPRAKVVTGLRRRGLQHAFELFFGFLGKLTRATFALAVVEPGRALLIEAIHPFVDGHLGTVVNVSDLGSRKATRRKKHHMGAHGYAAHGLCGHALQFGVLFVGGQANATVGHGTSKDVRSTAYALAYTDSYL